MLYRNLFKGVWIKENELYVFFKKKFILKDLNFFCFFYLCYIYLNMWMSIFFCYIIEIVIGMVYGFDKVI